MLLNWSSWAAAFGKIHLSHATLSLLPAGLLSNGACVGSHWSVSLAWSPMSPLWSVGQFGLQSVLQAGSGGKKKKKETEREKNQLHLTFNLSSSPPCWKKRKGKKETSRKLYWPIPYHCVAQLLAQRGSWLLQYALSNCWLSPRAKQQAGLVNFHSCHCWSVPV